MKITWEEALQQFLWHKAAQGLADKTLNDYSKMVRQFFTKYSEAWTEQMRPATLKFMSDTMSPATYNLRLIYLRGFVQFCVVENFLLQNSFEDFKQKRVSGRTVNVCIDVLKELLGIIPRTTFVGLRDYTLILLTLDTAIRPGEALDLTPNDLDLRTLSVNVRATTSKTRTARTLPIAPVTAESLRRLLSSRLREWSTLAPVFCSHEGRRMLETSWSRRVARYGRIVGVKLSPYALRHISATEFIRGNGSVHALRHLLGHTSLSMAQRYVHLVDSDIREQHTKASFVSRIVGRRAGQLKTKGR